MTSCWHFALKVGASSLIMSTRGWERAPASVAASVLHVGAVAFLGDGARAGRWKDQRGLVPPPRGLVTWREEQLATRATFGPVTITLAGEQAGWGELLGVAAESLRVGVIVPGFGEALAAYEMVLAEQGPGLVLGPGGEA